LKVSANVKIAMQCVENFGGANAPNAPPWFRACNSVRIIFLIVHLTESFLV